MMKIKQKEWLLLVFLEVFAGLFYLFTTHLGIGLTPDSLSYIRMSETIASMLSGRKSVLYPYFFHFPPLFPALLSLSKFIGVSVLDFAKIAGGIVLLVDLALFFLLVNRKSRYPLVSFFLTLTVFFLCIEQFSVLLTEPLFYMFILMFIWLFELGYNEWPVFIVILLASLTRYAGVSLAVTYLVYVILYKKGRDKVKGILVAFISQVPLIVYLKSSILPERGLSLKVTGITKFLANLVFVPFRLFLPHTEIITRVFSGMTGKALTMLIVVAFVSVFLFYPFWDCCFNKKKALSLINSPAERVSVIFLLVYVLIILFSRFFVDAYIPADTRIFSPIVIVALYLCGSVCVDVILKWRWRLLAYKVLLVSLSVSYAYGLYKNGIMYSNRRWKESAVLNYIGFESEALNCILSNVPEVIRLYTGKNATFLPRFYYPVKGKKNPGWRTELQKLLKKYKECQIVYFKGVDHRWYIVPPDSFLKYIVPTNTLQLDDGVVYYVK